MLMRREYAPARSPTGFVVPRRGLKRIPFDDSEQFRSLILEAGRGEFLRIFLGLPGVHQPPGHQSSSVELDSMGSSMPSLIDSRMPGMDSRNSVS